MDSEKLQKYRNGDADTFNAIMDEYQQPIYYYIIRMVGDQTDAEDLTQETFVKAYTEREKFRGDASIKTWLYRIASNLAKNHLRWRSVRNFLSLDNQYPVLSTTDESEEFDTPAREKELLGYLQSLSPRQRSVFILKYFNGLSHKEIGRILGISEGSSRTNFHYAVNSLKEQITGEES